LIVGEKGGACVICAICALCINDASLNLSEDGGGLVVGCNVHARLMHY